MLKALRNSRFSGLELLFWPLAGLLVLLVFNLLLTPGFFSSKMIESRLVSNPADILKNSTPVMILGMGMTLVIATGGVDLSVGSVMAIAGAVAAWYMGENAVSAGTLAVALLLCCTAGTACGAANGLLVSVVRIQPIIATLVVMVAGRGVALMIAHAAPMPVRDSTMTFLWNGQLHLAGAAIPCPVLIALGVLVITVLLTRATALGLFIESVGDNEVASRYAGINARLVIFMTYVFTGFCAAIAGILAVSNTQELNPAKAGLYIELDAIMAVVMGGTSLAGGRFTLIGTVIGAVLITAISNTLSMHSVPSNQALVYKGTIILLVCMLQSNTFRKNLMRPFMRFAR